MTDISSLLPLLASQSPAEPSSGGGITSMLIVFVPMLVLMYFLMIRPERKKQQEQQNMLGSLKRGDDVMLTSGFLGRIYAIEDKVITLEIGDKMRVRVLKNAIMGPSQRFLGGEEAKKALESAPVKEVPKDDKTKDDNKRSADKDTAEKKSA